MEFNAGTMEKLAALLRPQEEEVLQGSDLSSKGFDITATRNTAPSVETKTPRTIEEYEEQEAKELEDVGKSGTGLEKRQTPEYTMNYQQAVTAEDVFLQIGPKTPSSASCENLIVRIKMAGDKKENVDLSVNKTSVTVSSSRYLLKMDLPHEIDPDHSKANWDSDQDILQLILKLDREFDFINF